jgi:pantoate--beta-alanine ligase
MQVFSSIEEMQNICLDYKRMGKSIGLVPTMGALHEGHLALVKAAKSVCDVIVVSIFVNPIQFGAGEDYEIYPRNIDADKALLEKEGIHLLFAPAASEMYPRGYSSFVEIEGKVTEKLCGASRPGHFRGVATVVSKLFNICQPDYAFFGQKDAQQAVVIEKMAKELNFPINIIRVPTVREPDGLAMSSRNQYLSPEERKQALVLYRALKLAREEIISGETNIERVKDYIKEIIQTSPQADIDYVEILNEEDLSEMGEIKGRVLIALAVKFGSTRLIDNLIVEV